MDTEQVTKIQTTKEEREIMGHSLGIQSIGGKKTKGGYRNYFVVGPGCKDFDLCSGLVEKGLMQRHDSRWGGYYFSVTDTGKAEIR